MEPGVRGEEPGVLGKEPSNLCEWPKHSFSEPDCWEDGSRISWGRKEVILEMPACFGIWSVGLGDYRPLQGWEETKEQMGKQSPTMPSLGVDLGGRGL